MENLEIVTSRNVFNHPLTVYGNAENPLFLAKDVAQWIEHSNHRAMVDSIDEEEKIKRPCPVNNPYGGVQIEEQWFLTEEGLYEVLMLSRKPIAKQFKREVKKILKEIRTNGGYITAKVEETPEELCLRAICVLEAAVKRQKAQLAEQTKQILLQAPKVEYCDNVLASDGLHTINSVAVHLGISAKRLNSFLVDKEWIYKQGGIYYPSCKIRNKGYCDFQIVPYINANGDKMTREHLKWTENGRKAIVDLWEKRSI
jgi:prophage antirepressor-like protein